MQIKIKSSTSIFELVKKHPEIKDIMEWLGFSDIVKPGMLQSAGRFMTLEKGAKMKSIDWATIDKAFGDNGYTIDKGEK